MLVEEAVDVCVAGLGNFKGVMLCNRPGDVEAERREAIQSDGRPPPFKNAISATHSDPVGCCYCSRPDHSLALV